MPKRSSARVVPKSPHLARVDRAHTYALMAAAELVELDPKANSLGGRYLNDLASAIERHESLRYPMTLGEREKAARVMKSLPVA